VRLFYCLDQESATAFCAFLQRAGEGIALRGELTRGGIDWTKKIFLAECRDGRFFMAKRKSVF
jgi:hypothetical protein